MGKDGKKYMRYRVLSVISVGITIGFLLGMAVVALLWALLAGDNPSLEVSFTVLAGVMVAALIGYVIRTTQ